MSDLIVGFQLFSRMQTLVFLWGITLSDLLIDLHSFVQLFSQKFGASYLFMSTVAVLGFGGVIIILSVRNRMFAIQWFPFSVCVKKRIFSFYVCVGGWMCMSDVCQ